MTQSRSGRPAGRRSTTTPSWELAGHRLDGPEYELSWPKELFLREAQALRWRHDGAQEQLFREAFVTSAPAAAVRQFLEDNPTWALTWALPGAPKEENYAFEFVIQHADVLRSRQAARPLWRQRQTPAAVPTPLTIDEVAVAVVEEVQDMDRRGYFSRRLPRRCQSISSAGPDLPAILARELGWQLQWPLDAGQLAGDRENLFDVLELLHDFAARPRHRDVHVVTAPVTPTGAISGINVSCAHFSDHATPIGQALYRWRMNSILDRSDLGLRLADDGEDVGRLVSTTDEARTELLQAMLNRTDPVTGDLVRYAIHLFRKRDATDDDRRTAIEKLYQVLEPARKAGRFRSPPLTKADEDLFGIANRYAIRHGDGKAEQLRDYDSAYLDWLFWWYLATVELADRLSDQSGTTAP